MSTLVAFMREPELFLFGPLKVPVTAVQAAELVTTKQQNCHHFSVNPDHATPPLETMAKEMEGLSLTSNDGEAFLLHQCILEAIAAARRGTYGVAALLATRRNDTMDVLFRARNSRIKGDPHEFTGHAEMRLVDESTPYLQDVAVDHAHDVACVNLCPCPGCFGHMIDAHYPNVIIGSIDPQVGAAFLHGEQLQIATGAPRTQILRERNLVYRFPEMNDQHLRSILMTASWEVFHTTRKRVHSREHAMRLEE